MPRAAKHRVVASFATYAGLIDVAQQPPTENLRLKTKIWLFTCVSRHYSKVGNGYYFGEQSWNPSQSRKLHLPARLSSSYIRRKRHEENGSPGTDGVNMASWNKMITIHAHNGRIDAARQVFDEMPERNVASWTSMISAYVGYGKMVDARTLFDEMPERNVVSWTAMIAGYAQNGRLEDACQLFDKMPERDVISWNAMLAGYARNGRIEDACRLFNQMPNRDVASWNSMISGYAVNGRIEDARSFFDMMPERNFVSWNAMIAGYINDGRVDEARELFGKMRKRNLILWNSMVLAYAKKGRLEDARDLFEQMPKRNVAAWTLMVTKYAQCGRIEEARHLFDKMPKRNVVSWTAMIEGYIRNGQIEHARTLFDEMPERDVVSWTAMVAGYAKSGRVEDARHLFDKMPEKNVVSWNAMIAGYERNGNEVLALELFLQMQQTGINPSQGTFTSTLSACARLATLEQGKQIHAKGIKMGYKWDLLVSNALITMYSKCGDIDEACRIFDKMPVRDLFSWNAIIGGHGQHGNINQVLELFQQMEFTGIKPDNITLVGVLSACCHAGLVDEGRRYFLSMSTEWSLTPRLEHFACMVDLLGRSGYLDEAEDLVNNMPVEPTARVWGALLGACRIHGNMEIGNRAAECLFNLEPQNAGTYVSMSHLYAMAGRWNDLKKLKEMMKERRVKKQAGCSWIEIKNCVHAFVAGDKSHPLTENIYAVLDQLMGQMKQAGYSRPNANNALDNMD